VHSKTEYHDRKLQGAAPPALQLLLLLLLFLLSFGKDLKISGYVLSRILHGKQIKNRSKNKMADAVG
jgi:hypothetical protein